MDKFNNKKHIPHCSPNFPVVGPARQGCQHIQQRPSGDTLLRTLSNHQAMLWAHWCLSFSEHKRPGFCVGDSKEVLRPFLQEYLSVKARGDHYWRPRRCVGAKWLGNEKEGSGQGCVQPLVTSKRTAWKTSRIQLNSLNINLSLT